MKKFLKYFFISALFILSGCEMGVVPKKVEQTTEKKSIVKIEEIKSINDALKSGKKMVCTYKINRNNGKFDEYSIYIDSNKYLTQELLKLNKQVIKTNQLFISDNTDNNIGTFYFWNEGQKEGTKITTNCMKQKINNSQQENSFSTSTKEFNSAIDINCKESESINLSIPTDIIFNDQCDLYNNILKDVEEMSNKNEFEK